MNQSPFTILSFGRKIALGFLFVLPAIARSSTPIQCSMSEHVKGIDYTLEQSLSPDSTGHALWSVEKTPGGLTGFKLQVTGNRTLWSVVDPLNKKEIKGEFPSFEGSFSRLQIIPFSESTDYLLLECSQGDNSSTKSPLLFDCLLEEAAGTQKLSTKFQIPLAQSGHEINVLPPSQISPVKGWVIAYNGSLVLFMENSQTNAGLTSVSSWDEISTLSWYPSSQNIKTSVSCKPHFLPGLR